MADEKDPRELITIRHRTIRRQGRVPRSALPYLAGWYEVEDKPRRRRTSANKAASPSKAEADATGRTTKDKE